MRLRFKHLSGQHDQKTHGRRGGGGGSGVVKQQASTFKDMLDKSHGVSARLMDGGRTVRWNADRFGTSQLDSAMRAMGYNVQRRGGNMLYVNHSDGVKAIPWTADVPGTSRTDANLRFDVYGGGDPFTEDG